MKEVDTGILIRRNNYSESSLICSFYTKHSGIQKFIFQGGKKKSGALFPLAVCEITFYKRPDSELGKLVDASPALVTNEIVLNPMKSALAFFVADVLRHTLKTEEKDIQLFSFIVTSIQEINNLLPEELPFYSTFFLVHLSEKMGIDPLRQEDSVKYFHLNEGEFSNSLRPGEISFTGLSVQLILQMLKGNTSFQADKQVRIEAFEIMLKYFKIHIPGFKVDQSLDVLKETLYS